MDKNLPITKEYLNDQLRQLRVLLLEAKWRERATDLSYHEIDLVSGRLDLIIRDLGVDRAISQRPKILGHKG